MPGCGRKSPDGRAGDDRKVEVLLRRNGSEAGEAGASDRTRQPPQQQHSINNSDGIGAVDEVPPPSLDEITSTIKQLKSNKSAGSDGLAAELFEMEPERLTVEMRVEKCRT